MKQKNKQGFSLPEILIVVGIIALLAAIAIPNLLRARILANQSMTQANLKTLSTALENYATTNVQYPTTTTALLTATPPYMDEDFFAQPFNGYSYTATLNQYTYQITATPLSSSTGTSSYTIQTGGVLTAY